MKECDEHIVLEDILQAGLDRLTRDTDFGLVERTAREVKALLDEFVELQEREHRVTSIEIDEELGMLLSISERTGRWRRQSEE